MKYRYCVFRIIGQDVPPRHVEGNSFESLKYLLEHEPPLTGAYKKYYLQHNLPRLYRERIEELLVQHNCSWITGLSSFATLNQSRNYCIEKGLESAEYVLPLDGRSYFTEQDWIQFDRIARATNEAGYVLPQVQIPSSNEDPGYNFYETAVYEGKRVTFLREPALAFSVDMTVRYPAATRYGSDVSSWYLMRGLGVPGIWDHVSPDIFLKTPFYHKLKYAGCVHRLSSGNDEADFNIHARKAAKNEGLEKIRSKT